MGNSLKNLEKNIIKQLNISFNFIDKAYKVLKYLVENEENLNEKERTDLYTYGIDKAIIDLVRLSNIKKSLAAINKNNLKKFEYTIDIDDLT